RRTSEVLARGRRVWRLTAQISLIASSVVRAAVVGVAVAGAYLLTTGDGDPAQLTAIWLLVLSFCATVEHLSRLIPELQQALGSWRRVELLRGARQEPVGGVAPVDGDLAVRGLTFRYADDGPADPSRPAVLRGVTLTF